MILSASGGLVYHARAAFSRIARAVKRDPWAATRRSVSTCLEKWLPRSQPKTLVIVGPSGAYLLPRDFFELVAHDLRLVVIEPDPIAGIMLRARFSSSDITHHRRADILPFHSQSPDEFKNFLLATRAEADGPIAVLFFGVLGQIDLHRDTFTRGREEAQSLLLRTLRELHVPWASLHDLESTRLKEPLVSIEDLQRDFANGFGDRANSGHEQFIRLEAAAVALEKQGHGPIEWTDHETAWLGAPRAVIPWRISPRNIHLMGWVES